MNKQAAEKIAQEYYALGTNLALEKIAKISLQEIGDAMDAQQALHSGSVEDRIGAALEQRRREGALAGTGYGGIGGALAGLAAGYGNKGNAAKAILGAILGGTGGAVAGNLVGRGLGLAAGGVEGGLAALPGVSGSADFLTRPLDEY